jgi:uncharacterized delta-60 repeat protein
MSMQSWVRGWVTHRGENRPTQRNRAVLCLERLECRDTPSVGGLDPTFGVGGLVRTPFVGGSSAQAVALQPDGKIVVAGSSGGAFALARYNPDGSLDRSFDLDGKVTTLFGGGDGSANAVAIQRDGKIVVAGTSGGAFALARYNADGSLDNTFHGDGKETTSILAVSYATSLALQPDGKIVVAGAAIQGGFGPGAGQSYVAVARYNADGSLDKSFDNDGTLTTYWGSNDLVGSGVAVQADGKVVVAGTMSAAGPTGQHTYFVVLRYNGDGTLDNKFHGGAVRTDVGPGGFAAGLALQADGKIVVAGDTRNQFGPGRLVLARYQTDGGLDFSFGVKATASAGFGATVDAEAGAVAVQSDGKIVVAGDITQGPRQDFALTRFTADGRLDASIAGSQVIASFGATAGAQALVLQPDGKAVAAGDSSGGFALARFDLGPVRLAAPTTITLTSSAPGWAPFGQPVTLTATVAVRDPKGGVPTGYVSFLEGASLLGTRPLLNGSATFSGLLFGPGRHPITAVYSGTPGFSPSASAVLTHTVKATTLTALTTAPPFGRGNQPPVLTATVLATSPTTHEPTGYVVFKEGSLILGTVRLNEAGQSARFRLKAAVGRHTVQAFYQGDDNFAPSASTAVSITFAAG